MTLDLTTILTLAALVWWGRILMRLARGKWLPGREE